MCVYVVDAVEKTNLSFSIFFTSNSYQSVRASENEKKRVQEVTVAVFIHCNVEVKTRWWFAFFRVKEWKKKKM